MLYICVACMCSVYVVSWAHRSVDGSMSATKNIIIVKWAEYVMTCVMYCNVVQSLWWNATQALAWPRESRAPLVPFGRFLDFQPHFAGYIPTYIWTSMLCNSNGMPHLLTSSLTLQGIYLLIYEPVRHVTLMACLTFLLPATFCRVYAYLYMNQHAV